MSCRILVISFVAISPESIPLLEILMLSPQMMSVAFQIRELLASLRLSVSVSASFMVVHLSSSVGDDGPSFRIVRSGSLTWLFWRTRVLPEVTVDQCVQKSSLVARRRFIL
jgi:hypothetical protein